MHDAEQAAVDGKMKDEGPGEGGAWAGPSRCARREVEGRLFLSLVSKLAGCCGRVAFVQQRTEQEGSADQQGQLYRSHGYHVAALVHEQGHNPVVGDKANRACQHEARDGIGAG